MGQATGGEHVPRWTRLPAVALVEGERIVFASPELADLTGYTANEITSAEFRFEYLFSREGAPRCVAGEPGSLQRVRADLAPLRGDPFGCVVTMQTLQGSPRPMVAVVIQREVFAADVEPEELAARTSRSIVRGVRSALARELVALRQVLEGIEALEVAPDTILRGDLPEIARLHASIAEVEEARSRLSRRARMLGN